MEARSSMGFVPPTWERWRDAGAPRDGARRDTKPRAAPRPFCLELRQPGLQRVLFDVGDHFLVMFGVAHVAVEILPLPEFTTPLQKFVCFVARVGLLRLANVRQRETRP